MRPPGFWDDGFPFGLYFLGKEGTIVEQHRINRAIRARSVRVIDESGKQIGIMDLERALSLAREQGLDLVEVAPQATPPVCRLMDYGKFRYLQKKKQQEAKKRQQVIEVKEIKLRPLIDKHDLEIKMRSVREFLSEGNKVKLNVFFRGREIAHPEIAEDLLRRVVEILGTKARVESPPVMDGKRMVMVLAPAMSKKGDSGNDGKEKVQVPVIVGNPGEKPVSQPP